MSSLFSHFLGERSFKSRQNPRVDFFSGKKRLRRFKTAFFHLLLLSFVVDGLFTTPVYSPRSIGVRAGGARGAAAPPKILGNSDFLGSKRKFGQSQFLKTFPCLLYYYFEEINIFYFNLKSV